MDKAQLAKWIVAIAARGIAWFFAVKLGMSAAQANLDAAAIAEAVGALVLAGISVYSSVKGRKALAKQPPPALPHGVASRL